MNISDRAQQLNSRPPQTKPRCPDSCTMLLVKLEDKTKIWRCEICDHSIRQDTYPDSTMQGGLF